MHRDIKPENVVIAADDTAKLCDFGMAEYHHHVVAHGSGTGPYMAPEIHAAQVKLHEHSPCFLSHPPQPGFRADCAHDVWAMGVMLFVLLTGDFPWLKAVPSDNEYRAFTSRNFTRAPWNRLHPHCIAVC